MNYSKLFIEMAEIGAQMDVLRALFLLSEAYIDSCGISLSSRTVYYIAAEGWLNKLGESEHELAIDARHQALVNLFPIINNRYIPEKYDHYDISPIDDERCVDIAEFILNDNHDDELMQALCAGLMLTFHEDDTTYFSDLLIGRFNAKSDEHYQLYLFHSEFKDSSESHVKLHLFKLEELKMNFHFILDLSWFLATDEMKLLYQKDKGHELDMFDNPCSWTGYESLKESLLKYLTGPVDKWFLCDKNYESQLQFLVEEYDDCAKEMKVKTILEKMVDIGLEPLKKYENYMK